MSFKRLFLLFLSGWATVGLSLGGGGCAHPPKAIQKPPSPSAPLSPTSLSGILFHAVQKGQTLYRISKIYGVTVEDLMRANAIRDPGSLEVGQRLLIPRVPISDLLEAGFVEEPVTLAQARALVGPKNPLHDWKTITLHHSATLRGGARLFHRDHLRRRMGGLFYHFVIGNGSYSKDGEIEVGWRWKKQVKANRPRDIQICLVGNFEKQRMTEAQFSSLVNLIQALRETHLIRLSDLRRHEDVKRNTSCPGRYFPFARLLLRVAQHDANQQ